MFSTMNGVVGLYIVGFFLGVAAVFGVALLLSKVMRFWLRNHAILLLIWGSILFKLVPMPILHVSGGELPVENTFAQWVIDSYKLNLAEQNNDRSKNQTWAQTSDFSSFLTIEEQREADNEMNSWLRLARLYPESIFEDFPQERLINARNSKGELYYEEVLFEALKKNPELAFLYLDRYKDWKGHWDKSILRDMLEFAISQKPQLAYTYLKEYEELVDGNEKIAKPLLEKATELYQNKLNFGDLFSKKPARWNKKNLILVFFESASAVDSKRTGGLYDVFPWVDKISEAGVLFTNMFANGATSEMGHIATLMGVEPTFLGTSLDTGYERFSGVVEGLGSFFKNLGYKTHFVSTASLDFLNQRTFLKKVWFDTFWEDGYDDWKKYTFNAAPDMALYEKTLDVVAAQTSPYFIGLQTISSHTPYATPYGNTADAAFRYMDQSFAKFYLKLKKTWFFENGILLVVGDHRKMTPLGGDEYRKWGPSAEARIVAFMIGSGIKAGEIDDRLYQQTDIFYSLMKEFWSGEVQVLDQSNDIFTQEITRNWAVKNFTIKQQAYAFNLSGDTGLVDIPKREFTEDAGMFDKKAITNYLYLGLKYQKNQNSDDISPSSQTGTKSQTVLISHRGEHSDTSENSYAAFWKASKYDAGAIEFDVTPTKDWKLVVFHGPKLYSTSCKQIQKDICQMTYEELKECKLSNGEDIWLLSSRLPKMKLLAPLLFLDMKIPENSACKDLKPQELFAQAKEIVMNNSMQEQVIFSSDNEELTSYFWKDSDMMTSVDANWKAASQLLPRGNYMYYMAPYQVFTPDVVLSLKMMKNRLGQKIIPIAYTVNDVGVFRRLKKLGVNYVMTDELLRLGEEDKK